jgi:tRNA modification GTPase
LPQLEESVVELVLAGKALYGENALITSARHQEALRRAAEHLRASVSSLDAQVPLDFVSIDLRAAYDDLGEVTGETASEDLLDTIFGEFCIGK